MRLVKNLEKAGKGHRWKILQNLPGRYVADEKGVIQTKNSLVCFFSLLLKTLRIDYSAGALVRSYNLSGSILGCVVEHWYTEGVFSLFRTARIRISYNLYGQNRILH